MKSSEYEVGDILLIQRYGKEVIARVAGYFDSLDGTKPLYVNLRVADEKRWGRARVNVLSEQIVKALPEWRKARKAVEEKQ